MPKQFFLVLLCSAAMLCLPGYGSAATIVTCPATSYVGPSNFSFSDAAGASANCTVLISGGAVNVSGGLLGQANLGGTEVLTYDGTGLPVRLLDIDGRTISFAPQSERLTAAVGPFGQLTTFTYDAGGHLVAQHDPSGTTSFTYDAAGRLLLVSQGGGITSNTYDAAGNLVSSTDPLGHTTQFQYDAGGHLLRNVDYLGNTTLYTYDAAGQMVSRTDPLGHTTSYTYDAAGHELSETDYLGHTTHYTYDAAGQMISTTDPLGAVTAFAYNAAGQLVFESDPGGVTIAYLYDVGGRLIQIDPSDSGPYFLQYDALGSIVRVIDDQGHATNFYYGEVPPQPAVPEPGTLALLGSGIAGLAARIRRQPAA